MNEIKEKSYGFEAVMLGATKDKNGFVLKLAIHPNDVPVDLVADPVGSRYMVGMAKLNDFNEIEVPSTLKEGQQAVQSAGMLCRLDEFQTYLLLEELSNEKSEEGAKEGLCIHLGISSRAELKENITARKKFNKLVQNFDDWRL
jgi:hypothetical protein